MFAVGWAWTDHSSLGFVNWAPGEPNEAFHPGEATDENCVEMRSDGTWNDNNCLVKRGFVCRHRQCKSALLTFLVPHVLISPTWLPTPGVLIDHMTDSGGNPVIPTYGPTSEPAGANSKF